MSMRATGGPLVACGARAEVNGDQEQWIRMILE